MAFLPSSAAVLIAFADRYKLAGDSWVVHRGSLLCMSKKMPTHQKGGQA